MQQSPNTDRLSSLPNETLSHILSYLCPIGDGLALVSTSKTLHEKLIVRLYKEAGRQLDWLPLLAGVSEGNVHVLERCLEAKAPLDYHWAYIGHCKGDDRDYSCHFEPCSPLDWAVWSEQEVSKRWLISKGVTYTRKRLPEMRLIKCQFSRKRAHSLVFDVRASGSKGAWRPVLYRREIYQPVNPREPYQRSAHLIWYGSEIEPCHIFPRLFRILKDDYEYNIKDDYEYNTFKVVYKHIALWISRFWLDMLLSSKDPKPIFESGFVDADIRKWGPPLRYDTIFMKVSLTRSTMLDLPSLEFARHFSPSIFRLLLDSGADASLIASAYTDIFQNVFFNQNGEADYLPTLRFYPLILRALIDTGTDIRKVEGFCFHGFSPVSSLSISELESIVPKILDDMANSGLGPEEIVLTFSRLAGRLRFHGPRLSSSSPLKDLLTLLGP